MDLYHLKFLFEEALLFKFIKPLAIKIHFKRCAFLKRKKIGNLHFFFFFFYEGKGNIHFVQP